MKVTQLAKRRNESRNGNRFYTAVDMAIIKHGQMVQNAREKRGELKKTVYSAGGREDIPLTGNRYIAVCGCGVEGCFIHSWGDGPVFNWKRAWKSNGPGQPMYLGMVSADNPQNVDNQPIDSPTATERGTS